MNGKPWGTEETQILRKYAGVKTAEEIGIILGRTKPAVHYKMRDLGLDGQLRGSNTSWSKLSDLHAAAIKALFDAGFSYGDIHKVITESNDVSVRWVKEIAYGQGRF